MAYQIEPEAYPDGSRPAGATFIWEFPTFRFAFPSGSLATPTRSLVFRKKLRLEAPNASGGFAAGGTSLLESPTPLAEVVLYSEPGIQGMPGVGVP